MKDSPAEYLYRPPTSEACEAQIGEETLVEPGAIVGFRYHPSAGKAILGSAGIVRMGAIIYGDVTFGDYFQSGHYTVIRAEVHGGDYCAVGNHSTLEGMIKLGNGVRIMSHVYVCSRTSFGHGVFVGPGTTFLNEKTPCRYGEGAMATPTGAVIEDDVVIGGGCTILPGVRVRAGSFVAAGALVTKDVPAGSLVVGAPGKISPLPDSLRGPNDLRLVNAPLDLWHPRS